MRYLETSQDVPGARAVLQRATLVHCKGQAEIHLFSALFEERHGDIEAARTAYALVQVSCITTCSLAVATTPHVLAAQLPNHLWQREPWSRTGGACPSHGQVM